MKLKHCLPILLATLIGTAPAAAGDLVNIAGTRAVESDYGSARGWRVLSGGMGGQTFYCAAEKVDGGAALRIGVSFVGRNEYQWMIAVPYRSKPNDYETLYIDDRSFGAPMEPEGNWSNVWLNAGHVDAIRSGGRLVLDIGRASIDHSLAGSAAAILKVEECFKNDGLPTRGGSAQAKPRKSAKAPRSSGGAWAPDMAVAVGQSVSATCDAVTAMPHRCRVKRLRKHPKFEFSWRIDDVNKEHPSYRLRLRPNGRIIVAVKFDKGSKWQNLGPFKQKRSDRSCFVPAPTKNRKAKENRGQDAWEFCIR